MQTLIAAAGLEALGNPSRLDIFRLLVRAGDGGANVGTIGGSLDLPGSTLNHHLHRLLSAGLISQKRRGREIICRADYAMIDELVAYLTEQCCQGVDDARAPAPADADGERQAS